MRKARTTLHGISALQIVTVLLLLTFFPLHAYSDTTEIKVRFKPEYKIKRIPGGAVTIYTLNSDGRKEEYIFKDFNADVVLSIYRRIGINQITSNLAKKYYLSEEDSRRGIKRVLNILEEWEMVTE